MLLEPSSWFALIAAIIVVAFIITFIKKAGELMAHLDELRAAVAESTTVIQSAIVLLNQLADLIEHSADDPAAIAAIAAEIRTKSADLAAAVTENTPPPPPTP